MKSGIAGLGLKFLKAVGSAAKQARNYVESVRNQRLDYERKYGADKDLLVQDPVCGVFIPKSQALIAKIKGEWVYFCSQDCMVNYRIKVLQQDANEPRDTISD